MIDMHNNMYVVTQVLTFDDVHGISVYLIVFCWMALCKTSINGITYVVDCPKLLIIQVHIQ